jgi:hypothetical protein
MGCTDLFCFICGMAYWSGYIADLEIINDSSKIVITKTILFELEKKMRHLNNCTILTLDDKIIHNCKNDNCSTRFVSNDTNIKYEVILYYDKILLNQNLGFFLHTSCWKFIYKNYGIKLKFSDLPILKKIDITKKFKIYNYYCLPLLLINYGEIQKYWNQDFNYVKLINDKNEFMVTNLLENNKKNISRVKKIISQFKLKNDPKRKGPNISATFYNNDIIKIGNNKNFWIIKNKWIEIKKQVVSEYFEIKNPNKKIINFLNNVKQYGEYSKYPIFISDFKINNDIYYFYLFTFEDELNKVKILLSKK